METLTAFKQRFLDDYSESQVKRIEFIGETSDQFGKYIIISFPSYSEQGRRHLTHYYLRTELKDFCDCEGSKFKKRCWHLKFRAIILKLFKNRDLNDEDWLTKFELFGSGSVDEIKFYILSLLEQQSKVSQEDLVDLDLRKPDDEPIDRRVIGAAFLSLMKRGKIRKLYQQSAQYASRKGGKVWVWGKVQKDSFVRGMEDETNKINQMW